MEYRNLVLKGQAVTSAAFIGPYSRGGDRETIVDVILKIHPRGEDDWKEIDEKYYYYTPDGKKFELDKKTTSTDEKEVAFWVQYIINRFADEFPPDIVRNVIDVADKAQEVFNRFQRQLLEEYIEKHSIFFKDIIYKMMYCFEDPIKNYFLGDFGDSDVDYIDFSRHYVQGAPKPTKEKYLVYLKDLFVELIESLRAYFPKNSELDITVKHFLQNRECTEKEELHSTGNSLSRYNDYKKNEKCKEVGPNKFCCESECPICLEPYTDEKPAIKFMPCGHKMHQRCFETWQEVQGRTCPLCRQNVDYALHPDPEQLVLL